jgi:hypothetical protein
LTTLVIKLTTVIKKCNIKLMAKRKIQFFDSSKGASFFFIAKRNFPQKYRLPPKPLPRAGLALLLPVTCHHHKRRRAGHGCRADPPPSRQRPLLLHVHCLNPLHLAVHRPLNRSSSPPAPFPYPRRCCRVTFRATTRCFVF